MFKVVHLGTKEVNYDVENLELRCQKCHRGHSKPRQESKILISFKVPEKLLKLINDDVEKNGTNVSFVIRKILAKNYRYNI